MEKASPRGNTDDIHISSASLEKAQFAKTYIEMRYNKMKKEESDKKDEWEELNKRMDDMGLSSTEKQLIKQEILHQEAEKFRENRREITVYDFEPIAIIGRGAFGEVRIVRHKLTNEILAMKKIIKSEMIRKNQVQHVKSERNVLALAESPWVVDLKYSFQDEKILYLVMEYLCGGDLMNILIKRDILPENEAKVYMAECVLAVESVHKLNYIHRDLKPDNILIDSQGHIKLADFGLCKCSEIYLDNPFENLTKLEEDKLEYPIKRYQRSRKLAYSTVGTPDYIAPEVFGRSGYDEKVDWWSLGVIFFEMVVGYPPFYSEEPKTTCQKIINWKRTFRVPREANISKEAADLIYRLVCDKESRLGGNGAAEIKEHPYFRGIDWDNLRNLPAPWVPQIEHEADSTHFDTFEETEPFYPVILKKKSRKDGNFIGFTFKRDSNQRKSLVSAFESLEASIPSRISLRSEKNDSDSILSNK
jgi:serine/threonine kinase 38